jgi:hypothetical protein
MGALRSAPFFGVQPSDAQRAASLVYPWVAFAVSAASLTVIIMLALANRGRTGVSALAIISVLAVFVTGFWLFFAFSNQRTFDIESSPVVPLMSPSPRLSQGGTCPTTKGARTQTP